MHRLKVNHGSSFLLVLPGLAPSALVDFAETAFLGSFSHRSLTPASPI